MKKEFPVVYVAGPFRGPNAWEVEKNIRAAECLAYEVSGLGAMPLCPHTNTRHFNGTRYDEFWLEGTLELLRRCDAAIFTVDWQRSSGARAERAEAEALGIPCFDSIEALDGWINAPAERALRVALP